MRPKLPRAVQRRGVAEFDDQQVCDTASVPCRAVRCAPHLHSERWGYPLRVHQGHGSGAAAVFDINATLAARELDSPIRS
jgi:hypothetical protein